MTHGYVRVSTAEQNEARQVDALNAAGVDRLWMDKQSGKDFIRRGWLAMMKALQPGDVLMVKSIDRLGRNYDEIIDWWRKLVKEMQIDVVVLDMPLLDTRTDRNLTGRLIADIVLQLLSYVAEQERENIRQRQREGIASAKARGTHFGRFPLDRPPEWEKVASAYLDGRCSCREAGRMLGVSHSTLRRWAREVSA